MTDSQSINKPSVSRSAMRRFFVASLLSLPASTIGLVTWLNSSGVETDLLSEADKEIAELKDDGIIYNTDGYSQHDFINSPEGFGAEVDLVTSFEFSPLNENIISHLKLLRAINTAKHFFPRELYWLLKRENVFPETKTTIYPHKYVGYGGENSIILEQGYLCNNDGLSNEVIDFVLTKVGFVDENVGRLVEKSGNMDIDMSLVRDVLGGFVNSILLRNPDLTSKYLESVMLIQDSRNSLRYITELIVAFQLGDRNTISKLVNEGKILDDRLLERCALVMNEATGFPTMSPNYERYFNDVQNTSDILYTANQHFGW